MKTPIIRSTTISPMHSKTIKSISRTPPPSSIKLKMFKLKDPLHKTRIKKLDYNQTEPITSTQFVSTNLTQCNTANIYNKTKIQKLKQIQDIQSCISALKSQIWKCKQFRETDNNKNKITANKRSFTFFDRTKIERELSNDRLLKKGKLDKIKNVEISSINPEHLEQAIKDKISADKKLQVRTILSNKIRGNLLLNIKSEDAHQIVPKLVNQDKSQWIDKFPEVRDVIITKNLVKKRNYLKSVESRSYNPYHSFLALPKHGRRFILSHFQQKCKE